MNWRLGLGLMRFRHRVKNKTTSQLSTWRAGVWAETFGARRAFNTWRSYARSQTDIKASVRIAHGRQRTTRGGARRHLSPLDRSIFGVLKSHVQARRLERRIMEAWSSYSERESRINKQVWPCATMVADSNAHTPWTLLDRVARSM